MKAQKSSDDVTRISPFADFFKQETSGSILILIASVLGLLAANSIFSDLYFTFLNTEISIKLSAFEFSLDIQHVINDGLMTIFFFLVGLEIKRVNLRSFSIFQKSHCAIFSSNRWNDCACFYILINY